MLNHANAIPVAALCPLSLSPTPLSGVCFWVSSIVGRARAARKHPQILRAGDTSKGRVPPPQQLSQGLLEESLLPTHQEPQTVAWSLGCISLLARQGCSSPELREGLTVHPELVCVSGVGSSCPSSQRLVFQQNSILLIWSKAETVHLTPARQSLPVGQATWKVKL